MPAYLAPSADEFGTAIDGHWTEMAGSAIINGWFGKGAAAVVEAGGVQTQAGGATNADWVVGNQWSQTFGDADITHYWSDTEAQDFAVGGFYPFMFLWRNFDNMVYMYYRAVNTAGNHKIDAWKVINGVSTNLVTTVDYGVQTAMWYRIKRDDSTNTFTFYVDIGGGWISIYSGVVLDAVHFNTTHQLYHIWAIAHDYSTTVLAYTPEVTYWRQVVTAIAAQRFWDDSPTFLLSEDGVVVHAFDAGAGNLWECLGASCVKSLADWTTLFKAGYSDDGVTVTWVDPMWRTIGQVDTAAALGSYDGHRFLHVAVQFNSSGAEQPTLTSFTMDAVAVAGAGAMQQVCA